MSGWLQDGKSAIQEAVADAFHRIEESAKAELAECDRRNEELLRELRQLQSHAANAAQLQQENESLRKQLQELLKSQTSAGDTPAERRIPLGELSLNKFTASRTADPPARLGSEVVDYEKEYKKLHTKCNDLEKSRDRYKSVLRQRIEQIDKWAEASDKQNAIIDRLRRRLARYQSKESTGTHADTADIGTLADDQRLSVRTDEPNRQTPKSSFGYTSNAAPEPSRDLVTARHAGAVAYCDTRRPEDLTEDLLGANTPGNGPTVEPLELPKLPEQEQEHSSGIALKVELSSDGPVFVSERAVNKRKRDRGDEPKSKHSQRIKSEHSSSGPECTGDTRVFAPTESLDFDEDIHVPTPKKPRGFAKVLQYTGDDLCGARVTESSLNDTLTPANKFLPKPTISHGDVHDLDNTPVSHEAVARKSELLTPGGRQQQKHAALQLEQGIRCLAEDGDADLTTVQRRVAKGRLDALLNSPSVRTPMTKIRPVSHRMQSPQPPAEDDDEAELRVPAPRELPHGKQLPSTPMQRKPAVALPTKALPSQERTAKRPSILREDIPRGRPTDKEEVPLRRKPMDTLRPEDFKPNPGYNDGLTYVYDEVVRGRQARSALSGCTDLNCCGKTFRSFAKAERSTIGPSVTTRTEDIKLLEDYLGDDAYKLGTMTRDEKEETWLLAKTWELATKFGRHRQRYSRMPSPPGYWTVEFPNTQERAEERRQAEEIQRALVNERYREAMRPGGRWLFRDEEGR